ncbi:MAG: hypothetical protein ACI9T7_003698 [Oleiphilaceae bacterium]|jgi:hypothetical protein
MANTTPANGGSNDKSGIIRQWDVVNALILK